MLIIPAIDLKDGRCVRLEQGDMATAMASIHKGCVLRAGSLCP